jgi:hypothetical protein
LSILTQDNFSGALNQTFVLIAGPEQKLDLQLVAVNPRPAYSSTIGVERKIPFTLHFRGPKTPWARQHTYRLENETLGALDIFLVPVGPDREGMIYEAVFG